MPVLLTSGALSDPVLFDTVVRHWLLAINCDHIAVGLSLSLHPLVQKKNSYVVTSSASHALVLFHFACWRKERDGSVVVCILQQSGAGLVSTCMILIIQYVTSCFACNHVLLVIMFCL